jgi:galactokinase
LLRARARHVVTENGRVRDFAAALAAGDLVACGRLMGESHRSLALDFAVSTDGLDALVSDLAGRPGVFGARLTGAGFGGCVVALTRPGALREGPGALGALHGLPGSHGAWTVRPSRGAYVNGG